MSVNNKDNQDISNDIIDSTIPSVNNDDGYEDNNIKDMLNTAHGSEYIIYGKKSETTNCIYIAPKDCSYYEINNCIYKELGGLDIWECPKSETGCNYSYECNEVVLSARAADTTEQAI